MIYSNLKSRYSIRINRLLTYDWHSKMSIPIILQLWCQNSRWRWLSRWIDFIVQISNSFHHDGDTFQLNNEDEYPDNGMRSASSGHGIIANKVNDKVIIIWMNIWTRAKWIMGMNILTMACVRPAVATVCLEQSPSKVSTWIICTNQMNDIVVIIWMNIFDIFNEYRQWIMRMNILTMACVWPASSGHGMHGIPC